MNRNGFILDAMTIPTTTLGDRVAAAVRAHMGWQRNSVADLAKVLDLGAKAARRRYNGAQEFSLYEVERLADWLEVDKYDLAAGRLPEHAA